MTRRPLAGYCPVCVRYTAVWIDHTGRLAYVVHGPDVINGDQCEASCWVAEDDELIAPKAKRKAADPFDELAARAARTRPRRTTRSTTA